MIERETLKMAECAAARCIQERRLVRKDLQRWSKNLLFLVGFERVTQELMGKRRWRHMCAANGGQALAIGNIGSHVPDVTKEPEDFQLENRICYTCKLQPQQSDSPDPVSAAGPDASLPNSSPASVHSLELTCNCDPSSEPGSCTCFKTVQFDFDNVDTATHVQGTPTPTPQRAPSSPAIFTSGPLPLAPSVAGSTEQPLDLSTHSRSTPLLANVQSVRRQKVTLGKSSTTKSAKSSLLKATVSARRTREDAALKNWKRNYSPQELEAALKDITSKKLGTRRAAVIYGIPRSTLRNKVYKLNNEMKLLEESERNGSDAVPSLSSPSPSSPSSLLGASKSSTLPSAPKTIRPRKAAVTSKAAVDSEVNRKSGLIRSENLASDSIKELMRRNIQLKQSSGNTGAHGDHVNTNSPNSSSTLFGNVADVRRPIGGSVANADVMTLAALSNMNNNPLYAAMYVMLLQGKQDGAPPSSDAISTGLMAYFQSYLVEQARLVGQPLPHLTDQLMSTEMPIVQNVIKTEAAREVDELVNKLSSNLASNVSNNKGGHDEGHPKSRQQTETDDNENVILTVPSFKPKTSSRDRQLKKSLSSSADSGPDEGTAIESMSTGEPNLTANSSSGPEEKERPATRRASLPRGAKGGPACASGTPAPEMSSDPSLPVAAMTTPTHYDSSINSEENSSESLCLGASEKRTTESNSLLLSDNSNPSTPDNKRNRPKRGQYRKYNRDDLDKAVRAVKDGEMSVHRAGTHFGVPHSTLEYKVKDRQSLRPKKRLASQDGGQPAAVKRKMSSADSGSALTSLLADCNNNVSLSSMASTAAASLGLWPSPISDIDADIDQSNTLVASDLLLKYAGIQRSSESNTSGSGHAAEGGRSFLDSQIKLCLNRPTPMEGTEAPTVASNSSTNSSKLNSSIAALQEVSNMDKRN
ncbi:Mushroom body large-type Kenyon cell-specific protein 1 [Halotydeus destructor]|nr:Mushroom body large-type Kenyon cell-specific protein 1 [Halotydeus destructor]